MYIRWKRSKSKLSKHISRNLTNLQVPMVLSGDHRAAPDTPSDSSPTTDINIIMALEEVQDRNKRFGTENGKLVKHPVVIIWLFYVISAYIMIQIRYFLNLSSMFSVGYGWSLILVFGFTIIIFMICRRVKEGIGCMFESYLTLVWILISLPLTVSRSFSSPFLTASLVTICPLQGLLPVYLSLFYIYRAEHTLNASLWKKKHDGEIYREHSVSVSSQCDPDILDDIKPSDIKPNEIDETVIVDLNIPCFAFLELDMKNYKAFASYLSHCFALENLLFCERVSVLYQLCKGYKRMERRGGDSLRLEDYKSDETECNQNENNGTNNTKTSKRMHRIKFKYSSLYKEYKQRIKTSLKTNDDNDNKKLINSFENHKQSLFLISKEIYCEFIETGSEHQINLSFETRSSLENLLSNDDNLDKFLNYDDFMNLFNECLAEIYVLMISMYQYKFKSFVDTQNIMT